MVRNHHLVVPHHELVPCRKKSLLARGGNVSLHDNLIIHGDNLAALKSLLPTYGGKVNCVYIDPPYNTSNTNWIYNDSVSNPMMQEWLGKVVDREDLTRHDKWLCMMMPRLKLLHELLDEDGMIFVSIDDNEVHHLRSLMDEVFGEGNFVSQLIHQRAKGGGQAKYVVKGHDYILVYAKNLTSETKLERKKVIQQEIVERDGRKYLVNNDVVRKVFGKYDKALGDRRCFYEELLKYKSEEKKREVDQKIEDGCYFLQSHKSGMRLICELIPLEKAKSKLYSIIKVLSEKGKNDLEELSIVGFDYPKPTELIRLLVESSTNSTSGDIVLDSFAGSGTTAHAVLELNKEDGGNRKFILVQCDEFDKETKKACNIADSITAERVRRVIRGVKTARNENLRGGLGGTFSYFQLGKPIKMTSILRGDNLPSYDELARFVFYTATGEEWNPAKMKKRSNCIGDSKKYAAIYLFYQPDVEKLKNLSLTLEQARKLPSAAKGGRRLIFAPAKFVNDAELRKLRIDFCRLPFEIYKMAR